MTPAPAQDLQFDAQNLIWRPKDHVDDFAYIDVNDTEKHLCNIFDETEDLSPQSESLQAHIRDWPTRYHLSLSRTHLLRPIEHLLTKRVLEIGSGCGAITRYLTDVAEHVTAVEGSAQRAVATRKRCRGVKHIDVVCRNIMDMQLQTAFDAVTLVGVLEYSPKYIHAADPVHALLEKCHRLIAQDGALIVAIENQFGLKYFAGADEDHVGQPFYGIDQNYQPHDVMTFGRADLKRRLLQAGFSDITFLYPFPDDKLPTAIFTESGIHEHGDFLDNLAFRLGADTQAHTYARLFSEEMALNKLAENRILSDLSNSFLVVARPKKAQPVVQAATKVHLYPNTNAQRFAKEIILSTDNNQGIRIQRRHLFAQPENRTPNLKQRLCNKAWLPGKLYARVCHQIINHPGWTTEQIAQWAAPWIAYLQQQALPSAADAPLSVQGNLVDCIPFNLIRDDSGQFHAFDLEWDIAQDIPLMWVVVRGLFHTLHVCKTTALPRDPHENRILPMIQDVLRHVGVELSVSQIESLWQLEHTFFKADPAQIKRERLCFRQMPTSMQADNVALKDQLTALQQQKHEAETKLHDLQQRHEQLTKLVYNQYRTPEPTAWQKRRSELYKLAQGLKQKIPFRPNTEPTLWRETLAKILSEGHFDIDYYLAHNPDVVDAGFHPLVHFARYGKDEKRKHRYLRNA